MNFRIIEHASDVLLAFEIEPRPIDRILDNYYRRHRGLGSKERRSISEAVFGVMRWKRRLKGILQLRGVNRPTPLELMGVYFSGSTPLSPVGFPGGPAAYWSYPDFIYDRLVKWRGEEWAAEIACALNREAQVVVRTNTQRIEREALQRLLESESVESRPTAFSPYGLIFSGRVNLGSLPSYKAGLFEIQEEASQLVGLLADPQKDGLVIDLCAGAGGKTLLLGTLLKGEGSVVASDVNLYKLGNLKKRARRAGLSNIEIVPQEKLGEGFKSRAECVLVDAPCSGTGTLRRNPDLKWRLTDVDLLKFVQQQKRILANAVSLVKQGGRLIYATCSLLSDENEEIANWFEKQFTQFSRLPLAGREETDGFITPEGYFRTDPAKYHIDGFFACAYRRN